MRIETDPIIRTLQLFDLGATYISMESEADIHELELHFDLAHRRAVPGETI